MKNPNPNPIRFNHMWKLVNYQVDNQTTHLIKMQFWNLTYSQVYVQMNNNIFNHIRNKLLDIQ